MTLTLKTLAILYARGRINETQVKNGLTKLTPVTEHRENSETWFDGDQDNTIASVQAMIGSEITSEDFGKFTEILKSANNPS